MWRRARIESKKGTQDGALRYSQYSVFCLEWWWHNIVLWAFTVCVMLELRTWINVCVCVYVQFNIKHVGQSLLGMLFDVCMLSCFRHVWLFATPWTVTHQAPLSMGFSRQEYCRELPFTSPRDLPDPRILHCRWILYHWATRKVPWLPLWFEKLQI